MIFSPKLTLGGKKNEEILNFFFQIFTPNGNVTLTRWVFVYEAFSMPQTNFSRRELQNGYNIFFWGQMVVENELFFIGSLKKVGQKNLHQNGGAHFFFKKLRKVSRFGFFSIFFSPKKIRKFTVPTGKKMG